MKLQLFIIILTFPWMPKTRIQNCASLPLRKIALSPVTPPWWTPSAWQTSSSPPWVPGPAPPPWAWSRGWGPSCGPWSSSPGWGSCWSYLSRLPVTTPAKNKNLESNIAHEATTSKISEEQLHYCQQRGLNAEEAVGLIVNGFCKEVLQQLPMEFAVEAQKLVGISLEGSVG